MSAFHRDRHGFRRGWHKASDEEDPGPIIGPGISGVVLTPSSDGCQIEWDVTPASTGQVQYADNAELTGSLYTTKETSALVYHSQTVGSGNPVGAPALTPGTTYYFRIICEEGGVGGEVGTYDGTFETTSAAASTVIVGSAIATDSKNNHQVRPSQSYSPCAIKFTSPYSSTLTGFSLPWRSGSGYSAAYPNYGTYSVEVQTDSGGEPSGTAIATATVTPATAWDSFPYNVQRWRPVTFSSPPSLTAGTVYHLVITNTHASPDTNYVSINVGFNWTTGCGGGGATCGENFTMVYPIADQVWPRFDPDVLGFERYSGGAWSLNTTTEVPMVEFAFGNGGYWGNSYAQAYLRDRLNSEGAGIFGYDGNWKVRERWTQTETQQVDTLWWKFARLREVGYTGTSDATWDIIEDPRTTATTLASGTFTGSGTGYTRVKNQTLATPAYDAWTPNGKWYSSSFTAVTLTAGREYAVQLSAPSGTTFHADAGFPYDSSTSGYDPHAGSYWHGVGEWTTPSIAWRSAYLYWVVSYQFYLEVV